ncbi:hypothetical protein [Algoriphagus boritolerans]|uniref:hypothetical protein n=1 Tax=Algoriphagus boritolerans TaxID=308111 RepID=UPI000A93DBFB
MTRTRGYTLLLFLLVFPFLLQAQGLLNKRSSLYGFTGVSGANLRQFNEMLSLRGLSPLQNRYRTYGIGYQARINDFFWLVLSFPTIKAKPVTLMDMRSDTGRQEPC